MDLIKREISQELASMAKVYPVVTILGPRQSGKTTLARQLFPNKPYIGILGLCRRARTGNWILPSYKLQKHQEDF